MEEGSLKSELTLEEAKESKREQEKQGKEKRLEDKIAKASEEVERLKKDLKSKERKLDRLRKQKIAIDASHPEALKNLILSHKPCDCELKGAYALLITILKLPRHHEGRQHLLYLFPFKEEGYKGHIGDCLLRGHVDFTEGEKEILRRYGIRYEHSYFGQWRGH